MKNITTINIKTLLQSQRIYANWKKAHSLSKWRHNSIMAHISLKIFWWNFSNSKLGSHWKFQLHSYHQKKVMPNWSGWWAKKPPPLPGIGLKTRHWSTIMTIILIVKICKVFQVFGQYSPFILLNIKIYDIENLEVTQNR